MPPSPPHAPGREPRPPGLRKPSLGAILLGLVPFTAMCFSVSLWDRVDPLVFGLPFNLFWLVSWIGLSSVCMGFAYRLEISRRPKNGDRPQ